MNIKIKNKKAQLGKIITNLPVLLLIFLVIAIYLILAVTIYGIKKADTLNAPTIESTIPSTLEGIKLNQNDFLFKEITINNEQITVLNALINFYDKKIEQSVLEDELRKIIEKENYILILTIGEESSSGAVLRKDFVIRRNKKIYEFPDEIIMNYRIDGFLKASSFTINENQQTKKLSIEYYYGEIKQ